MVVATYNNTNLAVSLFISSKPICFIPTLTQPDETLRGLGLKDGSMLEILLTKEIDGSSTLQWGSNGSINEGISVDFRKSSRKLSAVGKIDSSLGEGVASAIARLGAKRDAEWLGCLSLNARARVSFIQAQTGIDFILLVYRLF